MIRVPIDNDLALDDSAALVDAWFEWVAADADERVDLELSALADQAMNIAHPELAPRGCGLGPSQEDAA